MNTPCPRCEDLSGLLAAAVEIHKNLIVNLHPQDFREKWGQKDYWVVTLGLLRLDQQGKWDYQPEKDRRDTAYLMRCSFKSKTQAMETVAKAIGRMGLCDFE